MHMHECTSASLRICRLWCIPTHLQFAHQLKITILSSTGQAGPCARTMLREYLMSVASCMTLWTMDPPPSCCWGPTAPSRCCRCWRRDATHDVWHMSAPAAKRYIRLYIKINVVNELQEQLLHLCQHYAALLWRPARQSAVLYSFDALTVWGSPEC